MSQHRWTSVVILTLVVSLFSGCQNSGRFSRSQYAKLDADPFLAAEADAEHVAGNHRPAIQRVSATSQSVTDKSKQRVGFDDVSVDDVDSETPGLVTKNPLKRLVAASSEPLAPIPDFKGTLTEIRSAATGPDSFSGLTGADTTAVVGQGASAVAVTDIDGGFDEWLLKHGTQVVQNSAHTRNSVYESGASASPDYAADFTAFPGRNQSVEIEKPVTSSAVVEENPFEHQEVSPDESSVSSDAVFSPPEGFSFP